MYSVLNIIMNYLFVFSFGAITGWAIEFLWRSLVSEKKLVNPGFLAGPYLPIYGSASMILYFFSGLGIDLLPLVLIFTLLTTVLELITGLFFLKYFNIRLWDYTDEWMNFRGIVCPKYSFFWTLLAVLFSLYLFPVLHYTGETVSGSVYFSFVLGIFYGIIVHDTVVSFGIAIRLKRLIEDVLEREMQMIKRITDILTDVNLDTLKMDIRDRAASLRALNAFGRFFRPLGGIRPGDLRALVEKNLGIIRKDIQRLYQEDEPDKKP